MFCLKLDECIVLHKKQNKFFKAKITKTDMALWENGDFMSNEPPRTQILYTYLILSTYVSIKTLTKEDVIEIPRKVLNRLIVDNI